MGKKALIAQIERRLAAIEAERAAEHHEHIWQYDRTEVHAGAVLVVWGWECIAAGCSTPKSGTNSWSHVPDHFPRHLGPAVAMRGSRHSAGTPFFTSDGKPYSPDTHWPDGHVRNALDDLPKR